MSAPGIFKPVPPVNEPIRTYAPGSPERASLQLRLEQMKREQPEIPLHHRRQGSRDRDLRRRSCRTTTRTSSPTSIRAAPNEVEQAIEAADEAWQDWHRLPWEDRAAVFYSAAELLAGPWRDTLNAATMLGQSKTAHQAEIDAACELIDFWRFNPYFMQQIYEQQPFSAPGSGTGWSTARSRASSSPSRRSTSRRSAAICRRPRRSWATRRSGSRPNGDALALLHR